MEQSALIQVIVPADLKKDIDALFEGMGLDTATAIRMFLRDCQQNRRLPLNVRGRDIHILPYYDRFPEKRKI